MRKRNRTSLGREKNTMNLPITHHQLDAMAKVKGRTKGDLLLRQPNFVSGRRITSFEPPPLACEASALTTELTALNIFYS